MSLKRLNVEKKYRLIILPKSSSSSNKHIPFGQNGCAYNEKSAYYECAYYERAQYIKLYLIFLADEHSEKDLSIGELFGSSSIGTEF